MEMEPWARYCYSCRGPWTKESTALPATPSVGRSYSVHESDYLALLSAWFEVHGSHWVPWTCCTLDRQFASAARDVRADPF
jgi:hypothetical protein